MFQFLFFDLDDTLLDFHRAEAIAVAKAFQAVGVDPTPELIRHYSAVNKLHWQRLERGELSPRAGAPGAVCLPVSGGTHSGGPGSLPGRV